jgi:signal transduction histidine kinase
MLAAGTLYGYVGVTFGDEVADYTTENGALALAAAQLIGVVMERARLTREHEEALAREFALREATRRMDEFLAVASHELRTPLTSIKANVQLAGRTAAALGDEVASATGGEKRVAQLRLLLDRTEHQLSRLDRLVGDLLDATRISAGKLELRPEPVEINVLARQTVEAQRATWPGRRIVLDAPRRTIILTIDPDRIEQVLTNYLSNACKYTPADEPIEVYVSVEADQVRLAVRDRGPGLSSEQQARLFERFSRVEGISQLNGSGMGLGLGLHICKSIVERHGGAVGVESVLGEGATFWFTLPMC